MLTKLGLALIRRRLPSLGSTHFRNYLSESYKCTSVWNNRLQPDYMQKVDLDSLYLDIEQSFNQQGKASVIDVDIFVNKLTDASNSDEVTDVLHRMRLTEETSNTLPSTGHAVVRSFLEHDNVEELINVLDDRLNYGIYLDHYLANYMLDELIKKKDFHSAARVATFLMLQEDFENEMAVPLALYACWGYLEDPKTFYPKAEAVEDDTPKEEIKVRVKFIRNEFFDDHFDIRDHYHLVGKTLIMIATKIAGASSESLATSCRLLGEILYQKYDAAIETLAASKPPNIFKDVLSVASQHLEKLVEEQLGENGQSLKAKLLDLQSNPNLIALNFADEIEKHIKAAVTKCERDEIAKQEITYKNWMEMRENKLQEELKRLERTKRLQHVEKLTETMRTEEQKLWFFENEDKIDLQIDSKKVYYPKRWFGKKKKPKTIDENYVPPEV